MKFARVTTREGEVTYAYIGQNNIAYRIEGDILSKRYRLTNEELTIEQWLSPVEPRAIFCVGLNYKKHAAEGCKPIPEYPIVFMKNPAAATGHKQPVIIPEVCYKEVDYEGELAVIIGKKCTNISPSQASEYIFGYTVGNDVSARKWQLESKGGQWCRGKSFDTFCPLGPVITTNPHFSQTD
jgi:2-keto-4-pentenoate hydratase/2-oxohepta-3-ene-1,7-dioic acid hydratase in catechol pathway